MPADVRLPDPLAQARSSRRRSIRCPSCGGFRDVSLEQSIRIRNGKHAPECSLCRSPPRFEVTDEMKAWWLRRAGVTDEQLVRGPDAYVREHGLPARLQPIAASAAALTMDE